MKKFFLLISIFILNIACIVDFWPKFQLYLKFKSIFQLGEVVLQISEIIFLILLTASIIVSSKRVYILIGMIIILLGNTLNLTLDVYNSYFTFRNLAPRIGYIVFYSLIFYLLLMNEKKSSLLKNIAFLSGLIGSAVVAYEKIRAGIFQANIFTMNTLYGAGMMLAIIIAWIFFNKCINKKSNKIDLDILGNIDL